MSPGCTAAESEIGTLAGKGPDALRSARRCRAISASMLAIRPNMGAHRNWVMVGEMPVERSAQLIYLCFTCALPGWAG